jgi:hypothetical protein
MQSLAIQYVTADNDRSGNPQRGHIVTDGERTFFVPDGFSGTENIYKFLGDGNVNDGKRVAALAIWLPGMPVTQSVYRAMVADFPAGK